MLATNSAEAMYLEMVGDIFNQGENIVRLGRI